MTLTPQPENKNRWDSSRRRPDPRGWQALRALVFERDLNRCQEHMRDGTPCTDRGTEVDHIIPLSAGGTDDLENLRLLCTWHHARKSSREGAAARKPISERKPREAHPGFN
jgi:5-methylcytosine-specific restriction endonuclease McrA